MSETPGSALPLFPSGGTEQEVSVEVGVLEGAGLELAQEVGQVEGDRIKQSWMVQDGKRVGLEVLKAWQKRSVMRG